MSFIGYQPVSRESMRSLKAIHDEQNRILSIKLIVKNIFLSSIQVATTTGNTVYYYSIPLGGLCPVHLKNMATILKELQILFPEFSIEKKIVGESPDKRLHIITNENAHLRYKELNFFQDYIVVDWT